MYLSIYPSIHPSMHLSIYLSIFLSFFLYIYIYILYSKVQSQVVWQGAAMQCIRIIKLNIYIYIYISIVKNMFRTHKMAIQSCQRMSGQKRVPAGMDTQSWTGKCLRLLTSSYMNWDDCWSTEEKGVAICNPDFHIFLLVSWCSKKKKLHICLRFWRD